MSRSKHGCASRVKHPHAAHKILEKHAQHFAGTELKSLIKRDRNTLQRQEVKAGRLRTSVHVGFDLKASVETAESAISGHAVASGHRHG